MHVVLSVWNIQSIVITVSLQQSLSTVWICECVRWVLVFLCNITRAATSLCWFWLSPTFVWYKPVCTLIQRLCGAYFQRVFESRCDSHEVTIIPISYFMRLCCKFVKLCNSHLVNQTEGFTSGHAQPAKDVNWTCELWRCELKIPYFENNHGTPWNPKPLLGFVLKRDGNEHLGHGSQSKDVNTWTNFANNFSTNPLSHAFWNPGGLFAQRPEFLAPSSLRLIREGIFGRYQ